MSKAVFWFYLIFCFFFVESEGSDKKSICLNMIVKNESKVIQRCLASVKGHVDYWVIVDTGSDDGTQGIIKDFMKDVPGELHERPWVDFGHNRSEALALSRGKGDYVLFMDADEKLVYSDLFKSFSLERDFYYINVRGSSPDFLAYNRFLLINNKQAWDWKDVLHEYLEIPKEAKNGETLSLVSCFTESDGARSEDPKKYYKDAAVLEKALEKDPNNPRYVFYLAQSYANAGERELALKNFEKRASMEGGWDKEVFWSLFVTAQLQKELGKPSSLFIDNYRKSHQQDPTRAEPLYYLSEYYNSKDLFALAYSLGSLALTIPQPVDEMYVQGWIYDYAIPCSLGFSALKLGKYSEASDLLQKVLIRQDLPEQTRKQVGINLNFALSKLQEQKG